MTTFDTLSAQCSQAETDWERGEITDVAWEARKLAIAGDVDDLATDEAQRLRAEYPWLCA